MTEQLSFSTVSTTDTKRRRIDVEYSFGSHVKTERGKGGITDKAKANYLSSQLRLRLQYAKLKVEHGWQRQTLSEVENLYFRHTHLTRPYPVISPGGRRNGRTLSSHGFLQQENVLSTLTPRRELSLDAAATQITSSTKGSIGDSFSSALRPSSSTLGGSSSSSSIESAATLSIPSTPIHTPTATTTASRVATPLAPHLGAFGSTPTRYPVARSDSMSTVIMESTPSLYQTHNPTPGGSARPPKSALAPSLSAPLQGAPSQGPSAFREPFDPMEPTEHLDSQLAALRSIISASAMPISLPPPPSANSTASPAVLAPSPAANASYNEAGASSGGGGGLTYDSFWSAHGSATTSYRSVLAGQAMQAASSTPSGSVAHATHPLQPHTSGPTVLGPSGLVNANTNP
ncbi:hypothetical protein C8Q80DRAFT_1121652 [Daedaleopsis nitida]|nr:hypothetical protein C8Q80DRAFT_1121652 [Daedaleopsis nitida]